MAVLKQYQQDQYATVFGGLNFMEFNSDQNIIHPIRLNSEILLELEESLILCYTGITHDSGNIHNDQKEQTKSTLVKERIESNVQLTFEMRNYLLKGKLYGRARLRDESLCGFEPDSEKWWLLTSISLSDLFNLYMFLTPF